MDDRFSGDWKRQFLQQSVDTCLSEVLDLPILSIYSAFHIRSQFYFMSVYLYISRIPYLISSQFPSRVVLSHLISSHASTERLNSIICRMRNFIITICIFLFFSDSSVCFFHCPKDPTWIWRHISPNIVCKKFKSVIKFNKNYMWVMWLFHLCTPRCSAMPVVRAAQNNASHTLLGLLCCFVRCVSSTGQLATMVNIRIGQISSFLSALFKLLACCSPL